MAQGSGPLLDPTPYEFSPLPLRRHFSSVSTASPIVRVAPRVRQIVESVEAEEEEEVQAASKDCDPGEPDDLAVPLDR